MTSGTSTMEEPYLAVQPRPAGPFAQRRMRYLFLPVSVLAMVGVVVLFVTGHAFVPFERIVTIEGKAASKGNYFLDDEVQRILLRHGIRIHLTQAGSRDIATNDISTYDFVFPSGQPAGDLILNELKARGRSVPVYRPFTSPFVLATFREYAETLRTAGVATVLGNAGARDPLYYRLDLDGFLRLIQDQKRWNDIGPIGSANRITAWTPDICLSNTAATYLALVSFVRNRLDVPHSEAEAVRLAADIKPLVGVFGLPVAELFNRYATPEGRSQPVVAVYEHQFLSYQTQYHDETGHPDLQRVLLYPSVNFGTEPQFIPLTPAGDRLGQLLTRDPQLRRRAVAQGYRPVDRNAAPVADELSRYLRAHGIPAPTVATDPGTNAQFPALNLLEKMIVITGECR